MKTTSLFVIALFAITISYAQWTQKSSLYNNGTPDRVIFLNNNVGIGIASHSEFLFKTTNAGKNWSVSKLPGKCTDFHFFNIDIGLIVVDHKQIYRTEDNCKTWTLTLTNKYNLHHFAFLNNQTGWIGGVRGNCFRTDNNGVSWTKVKTNIEDETIESIDFTDNPKRPVIIVLSLRTAVGPEARVLISTDTAFHKLDTVTKIISYGEYFEIKYIPIFDTVALKRYNHKLITAISDSARVFVRYPKIVVLADSLYTSLNGGISWKSIMKTDSKKDRVDMVNSDIGYLYLAKKDSIFKTIDGGFTWHSTGTCNNGNEIQSMFFIDETTGFICDRALYDNSYLFRTVNSGLNWNNAMMRNTAFSTIRVFDDYAFAISKVNSISKSTGDLTSWQTTAYNSNKEINTVSILDKNTVFAIGKKVNPYGVVSNVLYTTTDAAESWDEKYLDNNFTKPFGLNMLTNEIGYVYDGQDVYKTVSGGVFWEKVYTTDFPINKIKFYNEYSGVILGDNKLLRTVNGGSLWENIEFDFYRLNPIDCYYASNTEFYVVDKTNGMILKTIDEGLNWNYIPLPVQFMTINGFAVIDVNNIIVNTQNSQIYRSGDGGTTWKSQGEVPADIVDFDVKSPEIIYGIAYSGEVFATSNGGWLSVSKIGYNKEISIYPNPANDYLIVKSANKINAIEIIDISGKVIISKDNIKDNEIRISTIELLPGTYICNVLADNEVINKKIVVLR